jgi:ligand-binding sensor domain-containing protein
VRIWLLLLVLIVGGCSIGTVSPSPRASEAGVAPSASTGVSASPVERRPLPSGFPGFPGVVPQPMPDDDPGLIGLWQSDQVGSAAYDFYVAALPAAGYPIVGLYPGGEVALIRFDAPGGEIWQMVARASPDGRLVIEIRLDRP